MKLIVLVLAVCMANLANTNVISSKFVKPAVKFNNPPHGGSDIDKCGCHEIVGKLKRVEANLLKLILNLRNKYGAVYSELIDMKKHVKSVSWYVGQTSETGHSINEQLLGASISLAQIMHTIRDLTINQQKLVTKTFLTESILTLDKRHVEYKPPAPEGDIVYTSCDDERITQTGTYLVQDAFAEPTKVVCVLDFQPGAYTVIQNRQDGSTDFYRGYSDYRAGFGEFDGGDYWLGLDRIHNMTNSGDYELFILLEDFEKNISFARYDNFAIGTGNDFYPITKLDGFSGPAGDSYGSVVGVLFSAYDLDLDNSESNCAVSNRGAWWYTDCGKSNLNGLYLKGLSGGTTGMFWETFRGANYSLKKSRMMVKRKQMVITTDATTTMSTESSSMTTTTGEAASTTSMAGKPIDLSTTTSESTSTIASQTTFTSTTFTTTVAGENGATTSVEPEATITSESTSSSIMPSETSSAMTTDAESASMTSVAGESGTTTTAVPEATMTSESTPSSTMDSETSSAMSTDAESTSTTSVASAMTSVAGEGTSTPTLVPDNITMEPDTTVMSDVTGSSGVSNGNDPIDKISCNYNCTIYLRGELINVSELPAELIYLDCTVPKPGVPCCTKHCVPKN